MTLKNMTTSRGLSLLVSLVLAIAMLPSLAAAIPSYTFDVEPGAIQNNFNVPQFTLTNTSTGGEQILAFSITIGDEDNFFYDFVADLQSMPAGSLTNFATELATGAQLVGGDRVNDRSGTSSIDFTFSDFAPGEHLIFDADIDPISAQAGGRQSADSRFAFLNNGDADNAIITVIFDDGSIADHIFEDVEGSLPGEFHFAGHGVNLDSELIGDNPFPGGGSPVVSAPVPEPGAALLFGFGLLTVASKPRRQAQD